MISKISEVEKQVQKSVGSMLPFVDLRVSSVCGIALEGYTRNYYSYNKGQQLARTVGKN